MVVAMARALSRSSLRLALNLPSRRLLSSSSSAMILARRLPSAPPFPASRFTDVRFNSELTTGSPSSISEKPAAEMPPLFPGCDYNHWLIIMDKPGGEGATKKQMIDCYIKTLATVVGRLVLIPLFLFLILWLWFWFLKVCKTLNPYPFLNFIRVFIYIYCYEHWIFTSFLKSVLGAAGRLTIFNCFFIGCFQFY